MNQAEARHLAKVVSEGTGQPYVADTVRETSTGGLVRGGYSHPDHFWAVFPANSNAISYPVELRNREVFVHPEEAERSLRETEKDIARDLRRNPRIGGLSPEAWERIRGWPGEFHPEPERPALDLQRCNGLHIAERCEHGETKQTCGHRVPWSQYRVRSVPCGPEFCLEAARMAGEDSDQQGQG